jgi:hypothetical protein
MGAVATVKAVEVVVVVEGGCEAVYVYVLVLPCAYALIVVTS